MLRRRVFERKVGRIHPVVFIMHNGWIFCINITIKYDEMNWYMIDCHKIHYRLQSQANLQGHPTGLFLQRCAALHFLQLLTPAADWKCKWVGLVHKQRSCPTLQRLNLARCLLLMKHVSVIRAEWISHWNKKKCVSPKSNLYISCVSVAPLYPPNKTQSLLSTPPAAYAIFGFGPFVLNLDMLFDADFPL